MQLNDNFPTLILKGCGWTVIVQLGESCNCITYSPILMVSGWLLLQVEEWEVIYLLKIITSIKTKLWQIKKRILNPIFINPYKVFSLWTTIRLVSELEVNLRQILLAAITTTAFNEKVHLCSCLLIFPYINPSVSYVAFYHRPSLPPFLMRIRH